MSVDTSTSAQTSQSAASAAATKPPIQKTQKIAGGIFLLIAILAGYMWWRSHNFEQTDNAYVGAHVSAVSSRISGVVTKVLVFDNQKVRAGDVLIELDSADEDVRVEKIQAQIEQVDAEIKQIEAQIMQTDAEAQSTQAQAVRAAVLHKHAEIDAERYTSLYNSEMKAVSKIEVDAAVASRDSAAAEFRSQQNQARAAKAKTSVNTLSKSTLVAQRKVLASLLKEAKLQSGYTQLVAPVDGRIGKKSVEIGQRIQAGQQLLAIVQDGMWVIANFKETQLHGLYTEQLASIRIDAFPGQDFIGHIQSFSPASGGHFALLPPDNATGNFTKIVQRVPVKIIFNANDQKLVAERIAPGLSAVVEVDLRQGKPERKANQSAGITP
jgi:membrane fusion protein, multidrug efflux system